MSGLDTAANRVAREKKKAKENQTPPLNPPFPYRVVAFDPWTFGLEKAMPIDIAQEAVP